jgi:hypothetical protein
MYPEFDQEPTTDSNEPGVSEQLQVAMYAFRHFLLIVELLLTVNLQGISLAWEAFFFPGLLKI